jgi:hypothetical protein
MACAVVEHFRRPDGGARATPLNSAPTTYRFLSLGAGREVGKIVDERDGDVRRGRQGVGKAKRPGWLSR